MVCACVAAIGFIVFPSNAGTFAWSVSCFRRHPGSSSILPCSQHPFLYADRSSWRLLVGLILATLSHLSYEAFYFQEATLIILAVTLRGGTIKDIPWRILIGVTIVNVACIVFNRLSIGVIHKTFNWEFLQVFVGGYPRVLTILGHATREHVSLITGAALLSVLYGSVFWLNEWAFLECLCLCYNNLRNYRLRSSLRICRLRTCRRRAYGPCRNSCWQHIALSLPACWLQAYGVRLNGIA